MQIRGIGAVAFLWVTLIATSASARRYKVSITSDPDGAIVYIDDTDSDPLGETPLTVVLSSGEHTLVFEADGYDTAIETIRVRKRRRGVQKFSVTLEELPSGFLVLEAEEDHDLKDVTVLIDGEEKQYEDGDEIEVAAGPHQVEVARTGYEGFDDFVEITAGETKSLTVTLVKMGGDDENPMEVKKKAKPETPGDALPGTYRIEIAAGIEGAGRLLRFRDRAMLRDYTLFGSRGRVSGAVYPFARDPNKYLAGVGVGASFGYLLGPTESRPTGDETLTASQSWLNYRIDARYKLLFGPHRWVMASVGYARETFSFDAEATILQVLGPADYTAIEGALSAGTRVSNFDIYGGIRVPRVTGAGEYVNRFSDVGIVSVGFDGGARVPVYDQVEVVLGGYLMWHRTTFGPAVDAMSGYEASGASDRFFGFFAGVGYRMP